MRAFLAIALLVTALLGAQSHPENNLMEATDGAVTVTVENTREEPISGAWVVLDGRTEGENPRQVSRYAATNAAGQVRFDGLPNGRYRVSLRHAGHKFTANNQPNLELRGNEARTRATLTAARVPVVTGQVFDEGGAPMFRAQVQLYRETRAAGKPTLEKGPGASTDDRGIYRIRAQETGRYVVMATHSEAAFPRGSAPRSTGLTFFPNSPDLTGAARLELGFDQPEHRIDIALLPAPATGLGVSVYTGPNGRPCRSCRYSLLRVEGPHEYEIVSGATARSPGFSYAGIPSGAYRILLTDYQTQRGWWAIAETSLVEGRATQLEMVTQPPLVVSGRVVLEGAPEPPSSRQPRLTRVSVLVGANIEQSVHFFDQANEVKFQHGIQGGSPQFELGPFPPHRVRLYVNTTGANGYLAAVHRDGRPLRSPDLDLARPGPWTGLELRVRFDLAEPTVRITSGAGTAVQPQIYRVILSPDPESTPFGTRIETTCSGPERCHVPYVPPGEYRAVALPGSTRRELNLNDPQTQEKLDPWIETVAFVPGENPPFALAVVPAEREQ